MPILSKFQAVTSQGDTIGPSSIAEQLSDMGLAVRPHLPAAATVTVTPLYNRIAVQIDAATLLSGTTIDGFVDARTPEGVWRQGTRIYKRYDADEYYGNIFNVREDTAYEVRVTIRLRDAGGVMVREYVESFATSTLSSETPQQAGGLVYYVDPVDGNNSNSGLTPALPKQWLNAVTWPAGSTIVIKNGDFSAATLVQRSIGSSSVNIAGTPTNWIRVIPYNKYAPGSGNDTTETFRKLVALNGPWTETSGGSGVWTMSTALNIGVVRDETTGWQLYHHNQLTTGTATEPSILTGFDPAKFPQLDGDEVQGWFINNTTDVLYIRTYNGLEPEADRYVGGYFPGLTVRNASYVSIEDFTFEMCQQTGSSTTLNANSYGLSIGGINDNDCHHIVVKRPTFRDCVATVTSTESQAGVCRDILFDEPTFIRYGVKEYFIDRCDYTEGDPYDADYGYHPVKASLWDVNAAILAQGIERLVIRNADCYGYDLYTGATSASYATFNGGKNCDIYGNYARGSVTGAVDLGNPADGDGLHVNAACWNNRLDDGAEPIALSPCNSGPVWIFNNRGDGFFHVPFKIGVHETPTYSETDGNAFKIIANNSFACRGYVTNETHGNLRFQTGHNGVLAWNNVVKGYHAVELSPSGYWFVYGAAPYTKIEGRENQWTNGIIYIVSPASNPPRPKLHWNGTTYDTALTPSDAPTLTLGLLFTDYTFAWSGSEASGNDPFPVSVESGLSALITTTSVAVRGVTCLADRTEAGLQIGSFTFREPQ